MFLTPRNSSNLRSLVQVLAVLRAGKCPWHTSRNSSGSNWPSARIFQGMNRFEDGLSLPTRESSQHCVDAGSEIRRPGEKRGAFRKEDDDTFTIMDSVKLEHCPRLCCIHYQATRSTMVWRPTQHRMRRDVVAVSSVKRTSSWRSTLLNSAGLELSMLQGSSQEPTAEGKQLSCK